jgi:predicted transposase YbfD/YdcC
LLQTHPGHGRIEERGLILREVQPLAIDFPFARTLVAIQNRRTEKRTGKTSFQTRYYLSSQNANERPYEGWIQLIRGHWAGVENRNHWRRDALWGEDRTRSRKPNIVGNLALLRSAACGLLNHHYPGRSHSDLLESFAAGPFLSWTLIRSKS